MSHIASVLKAEIARVARKELRSETEALKKASSQYRANIALLKRQVEALEKRVKQLARERSTTATSSDENDGRQVRYSAKRLAAHRAKLGLSAKDYGALVGVSQLTIYNWESEKSRPRASQLASIAAVRTLGKREAAARLAELETASG